MEQHTPVLLNEVLAALDVRVGGRYLDATFGRGGHTAAMLERIGKEGRVVAIDRDPDAVRAGRERFAAEERLMLIQSPFSRLRDVAASADLLGGFDGVLFDLGVSSPQLDTAARGFSFAHDGPLDMRMDNRIGLTAADFIAHAPEQEIARVIRDYGEERFAKRIAQCIASVRRERSIDSTAQLADIVAAAVPTRELGKHPATRTFQALRVHINHEFAELDAALDATLDALAPKGRLCAISFHSLEDGIVKRFIEKHSHEDPLYAGLPDMPLQARAKLRRVGRTVHPSASEVADNPRARSALMRVAERLAT